MNTSSASKGPLEQRLGHRLRDLNDRVRNLETRRITSVGKWRLEEDKDTGDLIATHVTTGTRRTLAVAGITNGEGTG